jgi:hypothetical protein
MAVFKRGKKWWYKFVWNGELIRESTKQSNKRTAEQMEAADRCPLKTASSIGTHLSKKVKISQRISELQSKVADKAV